MRGKIDRLAYIWQSAPPIGIHDRKQAHMPAITFVLLAHERSDDVADVVDALVAGDPACRVVIHYDLKSPRSEYEALRDRYRNDQRIAFVEKRVACGWGRFGLVEATVRALKLIRRAPAASSHVYLLSGSCMPIRPLAELRAFLDAQPDTEFIESETTDWITGGLREERLRFWFPFGIKSHPLLFNSLTRLQKKLKVKRRFPTGLTPRFGSQWWCLTSKTCEKILAWIEKHPARYRYFKSVWIPDECFFQTLAWKFARENISRRPLTFYRFNTYGKPIVLYDDHRDFLADLPYFFARKISPGASRLRAALKDVAAGPAGTSPPLDASARRRLSYQSLLAEPVPPRPGRLFHPDQIFKAWPGILQSLPGSFAVLFGPPALTRIAADLLRDQPGLCVMGRLLKPGEVDFGPAQDALKPFDRQDAGIRDLDPALYLARVFDRAPRFPVFELAYCDAPDLARSLFDMTNAIVLPIVPLASHAACSPLFWLLSLAEPADAGAQADPRTVATPHDRRHLLDRLLKGAFSAKAMDAIDRRLFAAGTASTPQFVAPLAPSLDRRFLAFQHGPASLPLADAVAHLDRELARRSPGELGDFLPSGWRAYFRPLTHPAG
ncbi:Core-2/I-branching enzyme [Shinella sp. DD12]|nr:Core-2/I-branching enzyme [Shinella sp. DD12]